MPEQQAHGTARFILCLWNHGKAWKRTELAIFAQGNTVHDAAISRSPPPPRSPKLQCVAFNVMRVFMLMKF